MIDYYDILGIGLDADADEIKKAYRTLSLKYHPDKLRHLALRNGEKPQDKFNEIKDAREVLEDADRRKMYDTFGLDLGEVLPEIEVWTIGLTSILSPLGGFTAKTVIARLIIWLLGWRWIGDLLLFGGIVGAISVAVVWKLHDHSVRNEESQHLIVYLCIAAVTVCVVVLHWLWPLLVDWATIVFLIVTEIAGPQVFLYNRWVAVLALVLSFGLSWLIQNWWLWILGIEVLLAVVMLIAITVAASIMKLWVDGVQTRCLDKVRTWRLDMRKERQKLLDEIVELKKRLQD